ncbi:hypothetical protein Tco_0598650 [Tanacetum coccineum]
MMLIKKGCKASNEYIAVRKVCDPDSPDPSQQSQQNNPNQNQQAIKTLPTKAHPEPKPAPAKPQEKKRKPVSESSKAPPLAKRAKAGKVVKKRTVKSSKQLVDEFIDEGVPAAKPSLEDTEEAIMPKAGAGKWESECGDDKLLKFFYTSGLLEKEPGTDIIYLRDILPFHLISGPWELSSLQHLAKDFSFGDQFLNDKPFEAYNEKTTADIEAE